LTDAQKWVASKPFEADLHCWSEGFDDWLSIDKVGHFRNLRKPRAPANRPKTIPPPTPEKPLFAATMAAIEKDASASQPLPAARSVVPAVPAVRANGMGSGPLPQAARSAGSGPAPSVPGPARTTSPSARFNAQKSAVAAFATVFDPEADSDSRTAMDAPAFGLGAAPSAAAPAVTPGDPFGAFNSTPAAKSVQESLEDDDDLSIGEVSRVVKLTDLVPKPKPLPPSPGAGTQSNPRLSMNRTASQPRFSPSELGMNVDPALVAQAGPAPDESMVAQSFAQRHRRGMIALIAFAALLVAGVAGLLFYITSKQSDEVGGGRLGGGGTVTIDTSRPEDIVRRQLPQTPETGSATTAQVKPKTTTTTRPTTNPTVIEDDPKGLGLKASEIEDMAAKQGEGTKRCYMRAQKGALGFEMAELKKISVTLVVGKDGVVSSVDLSAHAGDTFGQCLIARIKAWKFRESPTGGTFRISLAFSS
jgi:hypothetical protein